MRLFLIAALTLSALCVPASSFELSANATAATFEEDLSSMKAQYEVLANQIVPEGLQELLLAHSTMWSEMVVHLATSHYFSGRTVSEGEEIDIRIADGKINVGIVTDDEDDAKPASVLARRLEENVGDKVTVSVTHAG